MCPFEKRHFFFFFYLNPGFGRNKTIKLVGLITCDYVSCSNGMKLEFNKNEGFLHIFIHTTVISH